MKLNIVPARTGIQWVKLGIQTFFRQPLALSGLFEFVQWMDYCYGTAYEERAFAETLLL